ncbi:MAG: glucosyltransferase domain-containing protein [Clostridia bacterium]|nr:glucosyltransferase domain-containing protein [Clostridia bacterium]
MRVAQWARKRPQLAVTLLSALLFGLVAHGMGLLNKFSSHDDIVSLFELGTTISSGRWMLHVMDWLETILFGPGHFSLPLTHGLFSLLCIALAACLVVDLLGLKNLGCCAGLAGIMVAFPAIAGLFGYMYTLPYYALALLMMTLCGWLLCKGKGWGKLLAIALGCCSVGVYQAFLPLLLSLPLLYDVSILLNGEGELKSFFRLAAMQVACMLGLMVCYFAATRFFLAKFHLELNSYMGIDQMGSTSLGTYLLRAAQAYREFFWPQRNGIADVFPMHLFYLSRGMVLLDGVFALRLLLQKGKQRLSVALLLALLLGLMPLACNLIYVMAGTVHGLMTYGQVMQAALFLLLAERQEFRWPGIQRGVRGFAATLLGLACVMYARYDNQCYLKTNFQQQQAISWMTTLATQIKSTEGYRDDLPVAFMNQEQISDQTLYHMQELDFILLTPYDGTLGDYLNSYGWRKFMERWCGFSPAYANEALYENLPEVQAMPHYPDDGSIQKLGEVIVVNF